MRPNNLGAATAATKDPYIAPANRIAAWCAEIASHLNLPAADHEILGQAALLFSRSKLIVDDKAWNSLCGALGLARGGVGTDKGYIETREVLRAFHGSPPSSDRFKKLALILEQCVDLDSAYELEATVSAEPDLNGLDESVAEIATYLRSVTSTDLVDAATRLPVFPLVANQVIALLDEDQMGLGPLESLISSDQTLALHLIAASNSAVLGGAYRTKNIRQAIMRIGLVAARQVVLASSLRGMFENKHSHALWNHSLEVAESAARLAERSATVDAQEAFLAGLMHDLGKLAMLNLPAAALRRQERLLRKNCPDVVVERVLFGEAHTTLGARILRTWRFEERIAAAVESHHEPERNASPLCSILYLAEIASAHDPAIESEWRQDLAYQILALRRDDTAPHMAQPNAVAGLRFAATA